jgi:hypothetical protein
MAEGQKAKIMIDKVPAARASKEEPMPLSKDWRILYIRGTQNHTNPAIDFQGTLVNTFGRLTGGSQFFKCGRRAGLI